MKNIRQEFADRLAATQRPETDIIINNLDRLGFFEAPASTRFHLARPGGLAEHSVSVHDAALAIRSLVVANDHALEAGLPERSVAFAALLHDICKAEVYREGFRNVKNEQGVWEKVPAYDVDYGAFPAGHGEKSVIRLLSWGVRLTEDEILAIRWHMSAWNLPFQSREEAGNLNAARDKCPMVTVLQCADMLSSGVLEAGPASR